MPPLATRHMRNGGSQVDYKRAAWDIGGGTWPHALGVDVAGEVDAIGEGVTGRTLSERVRCAFRDVLCEPLFLVCVLLL